MLFLIYAASSVYDGYGQHFVVRADDEDQAEDLAFISIEDYFYEVDKDYYAEDIGEGECEDPPYSCIIHINEFTPEHPQWQYYVDDINDEMFYRVNV